MGSCMHKTNSCTDALYEKLESYDWWSNQDPTLPKRWNLDGNRLLGIALS